MALRPIVSAGLLIPAMVAWFQESRDRFRSVGTLIGQVDAKGRICPKRFLDQQACRAFHAFTQQAKEVLLFKARFDGVHDFDKHLARLPQKASSGPEQPRVQRYGQAGGVRRRVNGGDAEFITRRRARRSPGSFRKDEDLPSREEFRFCPFRGRQERGAAV